MEYIGNTDIAIKYITTYCTHIGAFSNINYIGNVYEFIEQLALDIKNSSPTDLFPDQHKEHISYALYMVAKSMSLGSPSAIASVYLVTRLEFYFRILSDRLNADGTWINDSLKKEITCVNDYKKLRQSQISDVDVAYYIMKQNKLHPTVLIFDKLDELLFCNTKSKKITDIGKRIKWLRDQVAHGVLGDISVEAIFYGLLTAIVFYNQ